MDNIQKIDDYTMYKEKMDSLVDKKKKEGKANKEDYRSAFKTLLKENGWDETIERYFFDGFAYFRDNNSMSTSLIYDFINEQDDSRKVYHEIIQGSRYLKNLSQDKERKILLNFNLLQMHLCNGKNNPLLREIISELVKCAYGNNGNTLSGYIKRYGGGSLITPLLKSDNELPKLGLTKDIITRFREIIKVSLASLKIGEETPRFIYLKKWAGLSEKKYIVAKLETKSEKQANTNNDTDVIEDRIIGVLPIKSNNLPIVVHPQKSDESISNQGEILDEDATKGSEPDNKQNVNHNAYSEEEQCEEIKNKNITIEKQKSQLDELKENLIQAKARYNRIAYEKEKLDVDVQNLRDSYEKLKTEKLYCEIENKRLSASLRENKEIIDNLKNEIEDIKKISTKIQEDINYKHETLINRISQRLNMYYQEYEEALNMEMSLDLGLNVLDTLGDVFKLLQKNDLYRVKWENEKNE